MRKLNTRFFLLLVGALILVTGALLGVHRLQASNIAGALLFQANQAEKQGRLDQAARFLGRYLEFNPDHLDERARLGTMLADPGVATTARSRGRARFVLEQVLARDPQRHSLRQLLCRLMLDGQMWDQAREHLAHLEKSLPDSGSVALLLGEWQEGRDQPTLAVAHYRRAAQLAPEQGEGYVRLANLLRRLDRKKGGAAKEIESLVATALIKAPLDAGVLVLAAELAREKGDNDGARAHLDKAAREQPKDGRVYQALARLENHVGQREAALAALRRGLAFAGKDQQFELYWSIANLVLDAADLGQARKLMSEIRDAHTAPTALEYLEARCQMVQGRWYEASRLLEKIRPGLKSVAELAIQADLFLGTCYEQLEDPAQQMAAFKRVLDQDPFSADARSGLAAALWHLGQGAEALAQFERLAEQTGSAKEMAKRKLELARVLLLDTMQRDGKDWARLERLIDEAEKDLADTPQTALLRAEVAFARGQADRADALMAQTIAKHPRQADLWIARAAMALRLGKGDEAKKYLESAATSAGDSADVRLAWMQFWVDQPAQEARSGLAKLTDNLDRFKLDEQVKVRFALAEALQQVGAYPEAERQLRCLIELPRHAEDVRVRLLLFDLAMAAGDDSGMRKVVAEIQAIEGKEGASWRYAEAQRLVRLGRGGQQDALEQARTLLTAVASQRPDWNGVALLRAEIDDAQGKTEQAIANYRRALEQGVRSVRAGRELVLLLLRSQRFEEAEQEIRKLRNQSPLSNDLQRLAVAVSLNKQDFQKAESLARQGLAAGANDFREYLWMGQVLAARGRANADAEKAFRRAVALADKAPETWVALVRFLATAGQTEAARAEMDKSRSRIAPDKLPLALGQCAEALGQMDEARGHYLTAMQAHPDSVPARRLAAGYFLRAGQPVDAETVLRPIVEKKMKASDEELAWARRLLALTLASGADARRQREALGLVGVTLDGNGNLVEEKSDSLEEQRYRAKVLAMQQRRVCRERAIALCEDLLARQALASDEQFLLAQLYVRQGPDEVWDRKIRELMTSLTKDQSGEPRYLAFFANYLLQKNDIAGAEKLTTRLEQLEKSRKVAPGVLGSIELKARALEKRGRGDEALALLVSFAGEDKAPAERIFALAQLQSRLGHLSEAIDLCERAAKTLPVEVAHGAAVTILRAHRPIDEASAAWTQQWERMEKILRQAIQRDETKLAFYLQLADLFDMIGDLRELEKVCRQVLDRDPDNLVTLNNLAWHVAPLPGRADEALALINRAIVKHGSRPELLDTRGFVYLYLGQGEKAIADLTDAVKENATAIRYFHLTRAHQLTRNSAGALAALQQANTLGLTVQRLHPAERDIYRQVTAELKQK